MTLNFSITKSPSGVALPSSQKSFDQSGGAIGRGESNDWVLPDPDRFLSSKHCEVTFEAGQYYLKDLSTNGTFINGSPEPIGKGGKIPLNNGDTIDLGDYQFAASVSEDLAAAVNTPSDDPFGNPNPTSVMEELPASEAAFDLGANSSYKPDPDAYFNNASSAASVDEGFSLGSLADASVDPLAALDKSSANQSDFSQQAADPFANPTDPFGDSSDVFSTSLPESKQHSDFSYATQGDAGDALNQAVDWPEAKAESGGIPEDWDDEFGGASTPGGISESSNLDDPFTASVDPFANNGAAPIIPDISADKREIHQSLPLTDPPKNPEASLLNERRPEAIDEFRQSRPAASPQEAPQERRSRANTRQTSAPRQREAPSNHATSALLEGLGLADRDLSDEQIEYIYQTIGELIPVIVTGMMQVLRSRASIKNEFRMNITTIQPIENNPLKFSANLDDAIENLFVRKSSAFKDPVDAFQEGFDSISEHQVAIIAGIRAAFKGFMDRFHPEQLEKQFDRQNKGVVIPGLQKSKYWNGYVDYYNGFIGNMENSFQFLFGDEFVQAYEEQLRRLAVERRKR